MAGDPAADAGSDSPSHDAADVPAFAIPTQPERQFPYEGGVTYEGTVVFRLSPSADHAEETLAALVEDVLDEGPYRYGDFFDLPMPLYLARDDGTGDVFRISVRDGRVRLHVLPATDSAGLRAFYERLLERSDCEWRVDRRVEE